MWAWGPKDRGPRQGPPRSLASGFGRWPEPALAANQSPVQENTRVRSSSSPTAATAAPATAATAAPATTAVETIRTTRSARRLQCRLEVDQRTAGHDAETKKSDRQG